MSILPQFSSAAVLSHRLQPEGTPFLVTQELPVSAYLPLLAKQQYGIPFLHGRIRRGLGKIHGMDIQAKPVKPTENLPRAPPNPLLESLKQEHPKGLFPTSMTVTSPCFLPRDFHYANILWGKITISAAFWILSFGLSTRLRDVVPLDFSAHRENPRG